VSPISTDRIPLLDELRLAYLLWLMLSSSSSTSGPLALWTNVVRPFLARHEHAIDDRIARIRAAFAALSRDWMQRAVHTAATHSNALLTHVRDRRLGDGHPCLIVFLSSFSDEKEHFFNMNVHAICGWHVQQCCFDPSRIPFACLHVHVTDSNSARQSKGGGNQGLSHRRNVCTRVCLGSPARIGVRGASARLRLCGARSDRTDCRRGRFGFRRGFRLRTELGGRL
jgi:hypothetical protein